MCLVHHIGGAFKYSPDQLSDRISSSASDLIKRSFEDIDSDQLVDHHTHIAGIGANGTGAFVNPKMRTWRHPFHRLKFKVYMSAGGVDAEQNADQRFIERLKSLI